MVTEKLLMGRRPSTRFGVSQRWLWLVGLLAVTLGVVVTPSVVRALTPGFCSLNVIEGNACLKRPLQMKRGGIVRRGRVSCPAEEGVARCKGRATLRTLRKVRITRRDPRRLKLTLDRSSFSIPAGTTRNLIFRVIPRGRKAVWCAPPAGLRVTAIVTWVTEPEETPHSTRRTITIRRPSGKVRQNCP